MSFVNIAKNSKVTFSSMSQWSTDEDFREIVTAEHNRDYSFHTNLEQNPWVELDLGAIYVLYNIVVFNIKNKDYQDRANNLQVEISTDKVNYEIIHKGFISFKEKIEFNLDNLKTARYVKLSIDDFNYFHLSKIEVFIDESKFRFNI
ncbi:discoidin domain-containing protein [uncultured Methanobrevibacter sp.]|uniref:galactose-binding domain-containing protein n=1 Tax=uncultured Methanobrevibacter sp. TaxID=253161 RepID=UPI0025DF959D|nr:discoidin domain-containing protein [uncultured Methanobrevibacter sp.]